MTVAQTLKIFVKGDSTPKAANHDQAKLDFRFPWLPSFDSGTVAMFCVVAGAVDLVVRGIARPLAFSTGAGRAARGHSSHKISH